MNGGISHETRIIIKVVNKRNIYREYAVDWLHYTPVAGRLCCLGPQCSEGGCHNSSFKLTDMPLCTFQLFFKNKIFMEKKYSIPKNSLKIINFLPCRSLTIQVIIKLNQLQYIYYLLKPFLTKLGVCLLYSIAVNSQYNEVSDIVITAVGLRYLWETWCILIIEEFISTF